MNAPVKPRPIIILSSSGEWGDGERLIKYIIGGGRRARIDKKYRSINERNCIKH